MPSSSSSSSFATESLFNSLQRLDAHNFEKLLLTLGIPVLIVILLLIPALVVSKFRPMRVRVWLGAQQQQLLCCRRPSASSSSSSTTFTSSSSVAPYKHCCSLWLQLLVWLLIIVATVLICVWGILTAKVVDPIILGVGELTLIPAALLAGYGFNALRTRGWTPPAREKLNKTRRSASTTGPTTSTSTTPSSPISVLKQGSGRVGRCCRSTCSALNPASYVDMPTTAICAAFLAVTAYELSVIFTGIAVVKPSSYSSTTSSANNNNTEIVYSYLATSWLFLTFNCLAMVGVVHTLLQAPPRLQPRAIIALALQWLKTRQQWIPPGYTTEAAAAAAAAATTTSSVEDSASSMRIAASPLVHAYLTGALEDPDLHLVEDGTDHGLTAVYPAAEAAAALQQATGITASLRRGMNSFFSCLCFCCHRRRPQSTNDNISSSSTTSSGRMSPQTWEAIKWYILALAIAAVYCGLNFALAEANDPYSGKYLGFTTTATVILIDGVVLLMHAARLISTPGGVTLVMAGARIGLIAYGTQLWLLGQSTVYAVLGIYLAHEAVDQRFARSDGSNDDVANLVKIVLKSTGGGAGGGDTNNTSGSGSSNSSNPNRNKLSSSASLCTRMTRFLLSAAGLLTLVTLLFAGFITGLAFAMYHNPLLLPNPPVPTLQGEVPQFVFGIGALGIVITWALMEVTVRSWKAQGRRFDTVGWVWGALTWIAIIGCGVALYVFTKSHLIMGFAVFWPPVVLLSMALYGQWVSDDFNSWVVTEYTLEKRRMKLGNQVRGSRGIGGGGGDASSIIATATAGASLIAPLPSAPAGASIAAAPSTASPTSTTSLAAPPDATTALTIPGTARIVSSATAAATGNILSILAHPSSATPVSSTSTTSTAATAIAAGATGIAIPINATSTATTTTTTNGGGGNTTTLFTSVSAGLSSMAHRIGRRNALFWLGMGIIYGLLVGFGAYIDAYVYPHYLGTVLVSAALVVVFSLISIKQWFSTLTFSPNIVTSAIIAIALHIGVHLRLLSEFTAENGNPGNLLTSDDRKTAGLAIRFSAVLYPALVTLGVGLYKLRDDKWKFSRLSIALIAISQLVILGFVIASLLVFGGDITIPAAFLGAYLVLSYAIAVAMAWSINGYFLPRAWAITCYLVVGLLMAGGIALALWEYFANGNGERCIAWLSLGYWAAAVSMFVVGASSIRASGGYSASLTHVESGGETVLKAASGAMEHVSESASLALKAVTQRVVLGRGNVAGATTTSTGGSHAQSHVSSLVVTSSSSTTNTVKESGSGGETVSRLVIRGRPKSSASSATTTTTSTTTSSAATSISSTGVSNLVDILLSIENENNTPSQYLSQYEQVLRTMPVRDMLAMSTTITSVASAAGKAFLNGGGSGSGGSSSGAKNAEKSSSSSGSGGGGGRGGGQHRMYFGRYLFPIFKFDPIRGIVRPAQRGTTLVLSSLLMALLWGLAAIVFIAPTYAGVMVSNVAKLLLALFVSDAITRTQSELCQALNLLVSVEPGMDAGLDSSGTTATNAQSIAGVAAAASGNNNPAVRLMRGRMRMLDTVASCITVALSEVRQDASVPVVVDGLPSSSSLLLEDDTKQPNTTSNAASSAATAATTKFADLTYYTLFMQTSIAARIATIENKSADLWWRPSIGRVLFPCRLRHCRKAGNNSGTSGTSPLSSVASASSSSISEQGNALVIANPLNQAKAAAISSSGTITSAALSPPSSFSKSTLTSTTSALAHWSTRATFMSAIDIVLPASLYQQHHHHHHHHHNIAAAAAGLSAFVGGLSIPHHHQSSSAASAAAPTTNPTSTDIVPHQANQRQQEQQEQLNDEQVEDSEDAQAWSALTQLNEELMALDSVMSSAAANEAFLSAHVIHAVIQAGMAAAAIARAQWCAFLSWAAQPPQLALLTNAGIPELASYAGILLSSSSSSMKNSNDVIMTLPPSSFLSSRSMLLDWWKITFGFEEGSRMAAAIVVAEAGYTLFLKTVSEEMARRRAEEDAAARRRAEEDERRRIADELAATEAVRKIQEEAELARRKVAELARKKAEEEAAAVRKRAEDEAAAARRREEEEAASLAAKHAAEEAQAAAAAAARRAQAENEERRKHEEELEIARLAAVKKVAEEQARIAAAKKAMAEAARIEAARKAAEEAARILAAAKVAAEVAAKKAEAEAAAKAAADAAAAAVAARTAAAIAAAASMTTTTAITATTTATTATTTATSTPTSTTTATAAMSKDYDLEHFKKTAAQVDTIIKACRNASASSSASHYQDSSFHGDSTLGTRSKGRTFGPIGFSTISSINPESQIVSGGVDPADIQQGSLGDCWLLSAFAVLAAHPEHLDRILVTRERNDAGVYAVRLWKNGAWREILVDDEIVVYTDRHRDVKSGNVYAGDFRGIPGRAPVPAFVHGKGHREWWMALLEKAYAKYYGSFAAIEGGVVHEGLCAFVKGSVGSRVDMTEATVRAEISSGALFQKIKKFADIGYLLGAGSPSGSDADVSAMGIVQGHAYSLLRVEEESDSEGSYQLVQLRNPWGSSEWKGAWSDQDKKSWRMRMRKKLNYDPDRDADDGLFWMSWADFTQNFEDIYICRVFRTVAEGGTWYRYTFQGEWKGITAGGCSNSPDTAKSNPNFYLPITKPTTMFISLMQEERGGRKGTKEGIGMSIHDKDGLRVHNFYAKDQVLSSGYAVSSEVTLEANALVPTPSGKPYTIFVSTYAARKEMKFTLTVYTDSPLNATYLDGPEKLKLMSLDLQGK